MPRKPYITIFRPLSIRLEQPPSPTPSPTEYIAAMRMEISSPTLAENPPSGTIHTTNASATSSETATITPSTDSGTMPTAPTGATPPLPHVSAKVYPSKAFDATSFQASGGVKIPPPPGIVMKPGAGGYTLSEVLGGHGWTPLDYTRVQRTLHEVAGECLNVEKSFAKQDDRAKRRYMDAALNRFPGLEYYVDEWPARDFAYMYLKNRTAQEARKLAVLASANASTSTSAVPN